MFVMYKGKFLVPVMNIFSLKRKYFPQNKCLDTVKLVVLCLLEICTWSHYYPTMNVREERNPH